jgi:type II secretory pathway pseudopilin PulG
MNGERGFALLEAIAVIGVAALCVAALALAASGATKFAGRASGPNRRAALAFARQTLRTAQDAWKYGAPGWVPAGSTSALIPFPARITASLAPGGAETAAISITVEYSPDPTQNDSGIVTLESSLRAAAPLPGTRIEQPGTIAHP